MSVTSGELKHRESANMPSDDSSTVGGAKTASDVGSSIGAVFHTVTANPDEGDSTIYQYKKTFGVNTNADTDLTSAKIWLKNALDDVAANGVISATSTSADDDTDYKIKVVGEDAGALVITEEITLNGTTEVNGSSTFSKVFWVELRDVSSGNLVVSNGDISIEVNGTEVGTIPLGYNCALAIVDIGLVATLDDSGTATNALTAPGGISFTRPRTFAGGLDVANSGSLSFGSGQGIWWRLTVEGGLIPAPELTITFGLKGSTT